MASVGPDVRSIVPIVVSLLLLAGPSRLWAQRVTAPVDSTRSVIHYTGDATMHDWTGTSRTITGMLDLAPETPATSRAVIRAPVASFTSGRDRRDRKMREVTEAKKYPTVQYQTTDIRAVQWSETANGHAGRWDVTGDLTFHGKTKPVDATADVRITSDSISVRARFAISLTRFDVERPKLLWVKPIADTIRIDAHVVGAIEDPATAEKRLRRSKNEVTGTTVIASTNLRDLPDHGYDGTNAGFRAQARLRENDDQEWSLSIYGFTNDEPEFVDARTLSIETSRETVVPDKIERKTRTLDNGATVEIVQAYLSRTGFRTVAQALTASATIGDTQFPLTWGVRQDLRLILDTVSTSSPEQISSVDGN